MSFPSDKKGLLALPYGLQIILVAFCYVLLGKLALLMAIPPGYATAIWPAAGVALAGLLLFGNRAWPGVLIGHFFVNIWTAFDPSTTSALLKSFGIAFSIGVGGTFQALLGATLVRRTVGASAPLIDGKEISKFMILGGPVACLVGATWGVTTLFSFGVIPLARYPFSWFTWYVGDTLGAVLVPILILAWTAEPKAVWRGRRIPLTFPLLLAFVVAIIFYLVVSSIEENRLRIEFEKRATLLSHTLQNRLDASFETLRNLQGFYTASEGVTRGEFKTFVGPIVESHPEIQAFSWNQRIRHEDLADFVTTVRQEGIPDFRIKESDPKGEVVPAGRRDEYVVVDFIEPVKGNESALGYNVYSEPVRIAALDRARDTGEISITGPIALAQGGEGVLAFQPVYKKENLEGFLTAVIHMRRLVEKSLPTLEEMGIGLKIHDEGALHGTPMLYSSTELSESSPGSRYSLKRDWPIGGRKWTVVFSALPPYLQKEQTWIAWSFLTAVLVFNSLLGGFLLLVTGRTSKIEAVVKLRTAELEAQKTAVLNALQESREAQKRQDIAEERILEKSRDLEILLHVTSHDLREPLRAIQNFSEMVIANNQDRLDMDAKDLLKRVVEAAKRLRALLDDILNLSRARNIKIPEKSLEGKVIVNEVLERLQETIREKRARIKVAETYLSLFVDKTWAVQALYNLVANALKFTKGKEPPDIEIAPYEPQEREPHGAGFVVKDRGPGVRPDQAERMFELFQRGVEREVEGTGAGLAIVKEIARRHGGRAWIKSREGGGSEFVVTFSGGRAVSPP